MNKRQKKKLFKQVIGKNPPKKMKYSGKSYHLAINKPWGGRKPTVNASWDSKELRQAVRRISKIFAEAGEKGQKAIESLRNLFTNARISMSEIPEPGNYTKNTENMVHTAEKLAQRRKAGRSRWK
ncbi:MAG: hypothetical protein ACLU4R_06485 [Lachnospiraceae bacterium]